MNDEVIKTFCEVNLTSPDDFLKVKETLTRIGISKKDENTLFQSCHILHKRGKYYIVHFKEMFALDGRETDFDDKDRARRNTIVTLLEDWGLVESPYDKAASMQELVPMSEIKIIPFNEKKSWTLIPKYTFTG